jgi:hippurate hydrolase
MHACGHDVHQTCLLGTATVLAELRDSWSGTVLAAAQPAEEIGKGARLMLESGIFDRVPRPDYCIALHVASDQPAGQLGYTAGWALANVDSVDITIFGRGGHGSRPNEAVDPIVAAAQVIMGLQTIVSRRLDPREPGVVTVGSIHGGSKHNIIPPQATMQLTVRSYGEETRQLLLEGIRSITVQTARAMGCPKDPVVHLREDEFTPAAYNAPELAEAAVKVLAEALGPDRVIERKPVMGGEDFGRFPAALEVPGFIFWLGAVEHGTFEEAKRSGSALPSLHSSKFAPDPEPTIKAGVRALTSIALSLLDPKG